MPDGSEIPEATPAARQHALQRLRRAYWNVRLFGLSPLARDVWMVVTTVLLFLAFLAIQWQLDQGAQQRRALRGQQRALQAQQEVIRAQQSSLEAVQRQLVKLVQPTRAQRRRLLRDLLAAAGPRERARLGGLIRPAPETRSPGRRAPPAAAPRPPRDQGGGQGGSQPGSPGPAPAPQSPAPGPPPQPTLPPLPGLPGLPDTPCVFGVCLPLP